MQYIGIQKPRVYWMIGPYKCDYDIGILINAMKS